MVRRPAEEIAAEDGLTSRPTVSRSPSVEWELKKNRGLLACFQSLPLRLWGG